MERSLVFFKPDFYEKELYQEFLDALKACDLVIEYDFYVTFATLDDVQNFYQWEALRNIEMMIQYWCQQPHRVLVLKGSDAVQKVIQIKKFFRSKYCNGCHEMYTLLHCPDSIGDYERELEFLLGKKLAR